MLKIRSIASGSKGNCIYIASETTQILVDIGLSLREVTNRLKSVDIDPSTIDAVLVTHEHGDHIHGVSKFLNKYNCPIYLHEEAAEIHANAIGEFPLELLHTFNDTFKIGDITVDFCEVPHDSEFCFAYSFIQNDCKISLATDLGSATPELINLMGGSQIVLLECNHDMLKLQNNIKYPMVLKRRISGNKGHLSNAAASLAIFELAKTGVQQIILAHLSEQNNSPTLAYGFVRDFLYRKGLIEGTDISIDVAEQHRPGRLYQID